MEAIPNDIPGEHGAIRLASGVRADLVDARRDLLGASHTHFIIRSVLHRKLDHVSGRRLGSSSRIQTVETRPQYDTC
jgi:hypothetical protein